jgi:hypothetical protein
MHLKIADRVERTSIRSIDIMPPFSNPKDLFCWDIGDFLAPPSLRFRFLEFFWCRVLISPPAEKHVIVVLVNGVVFVPFSRTTCQKKRNDQ